MRFPLLVFLFFLPFSIAIAAPQDARIAQLQAKIRRAKVFSAYDELIGIYKNQGKFDLAARLEREQSAQYLAKGLEDAAIVHRNRAAALDSQLQLFADVQTTAKGAGKLYTGAPLEPVAGCYLGAFIDRDDSLGAPFYGENYQSHRTPAQFQRATGKNPGSLFMYLRYGAPFPARWVAALKAAGTLAHIAWEPGNLSEVRDDAYLRGFARAAREADWPIFVRFASEMNGFWTPYHGNPALYRQKFRLVHRVLHQNAPRVATIWCVNNPPLGNAFDYYPGDDGCDWVGVNFYAVPFHENRRDKPAFDENPLALLDPIYARFSARKPHRDLRICGFSPFGKRSGRLQRVRDPKNRATLRRIAAALSARENGQLVRYEHHRAPDAGQSAQQLLAHSAANSGFMVEIDRFGAFSDFLFQSGRRVAARGAVFERLETPQSRANSRLGQRLWRRARSAGVLERKTAVSRAQIWRARVGFGNGRAQNRESRFDGAVIRLQRPPSTRNTRGFRVVAPGPVISRP